MKRQTLISMLLMICVVACLFSVNAFAAETLTAVSIAVTEPVSGCMPDYTAPVIKATPTDPDTYSAEVVSWSFRDAVDEEHLEDEWPQTTLKETDTFSYKLPVAKQRATYIAEIKLTPKDGFSFPEDITELQVEINGEPKSKDFSMQRQEDGSVILRESFTVIGRPITGIAVMDSEKKEITVGATPSLDVSTIAFLTEPSGAIDIVGGGIAAQWYDDGIALTKAATFNAADAIAGKYSLRITAKVADGDYSVPQTGEIPASYNGATASASLRPKTTNYIDILIPFAPIEVDEYEMTFDANGGTGTMSPIKAYEGTSFVLPENGFTAPDGTEFLHWSVDGVDYAPAESFVVSGDAVIKAIWSNPVSPTDTPEPSATPTPTDAPEPTETPVPTEAPKPTISIKLDESEYTQGDICHITMTYDSMPARSAWYAKVTTGTETPIDRKGGNFEQASGTLGNIQILTTDFEGNYTVTFCVKDKDGVLLATSKPVEFSVTPPTPTQPPITPKPSSMPVITPTPKPTSTPEPVKYNLLVESGKAYKSGNDTPIIQAEASTVITLKADDAPAGKVFKAWEIVQGSKVELVDPTAQITGFVMPASSVKIAATFQDEGEDPNPTPGPDSPNVILSLDKESYSNDEQATVTIQYTNIPSGAVWYAKLDTADDANVFNNKGGSISDGIGRVNSRLLLTDYAGVYKLTVYIKESADASQIACTSNTVLFTVGAPIPAGSHAIKVIGGYATLEGSNVRVASAAEGNKVHIYCDQEDGTKRFAKWVVIEENSGITLDDPSAKDTAFIMGKTDVEIEAEYTSGSNGYIVVAGIGGAWVQNSKNDLTFQTNGHYSDISGIKIDGAFISPQSYEFSDGDKNIVLKNSYLKTLAKGQHTITFMFKDGECSTTFTVKAADSNPKTGDSNSVLGWSFLCLTTLCGAGTGYYVVRKKKPTKSK